MKNSTPPNPLKQILVRLNDPGETKFAENIRQLLETAAYVDQDSIAYIETAIPLFAIQKNQIAAAISSRYPQVSTFKYTVDSSHIAGLKVRIGDRIIDYTVNSIINQIVRLAV